MVELRRALRTVGLLLVAASLTLSGCRGVGHFASDTYTWGSRTMVPNPVSVGPFFAGLGVGFVAGLPLCLISWPLTLLFYPGGEDEFSLSAALAPSMILGTLTGATLAAPLYPIGLPLVPQEP